MLRRYPSFARYLWIRGENPPPFVEPLPILRVSAQEFDGVALATGVP